MLFLYLITRVHRAWRALWPLLLGSTLVTTGCASLNADREQSQAAMMAQRVSTTIDPLEAWALPVQGESPAWNGSDPLGYDAAVSVALQGDPSLREALALIVKQRAQYVQVGLPANPMIGFGIGVAVDGLAGAPVMVQGIQMLSWLWKNPWRVEAAEAELRAAVYQAAERCVTILIQTRIQLAAVLAAQETLALDQEFVLITQQTVDLVSAMEQAGELAKLDLDRAQVDHEQAVAAAVASEFALREAKLELLATMGRPDACVDWTAVGTLAPRWSIPEDEQTLLRLASTGRLDVAASLENVRKIEGQLGLAKTQQFPEVGLMLSYRRNFSERKALLPGAEVTIPILNNGQPAIAVERASLEAARMELLAISEQAQREVRTSLNQMLDARARVRIIREGQLDAAIRANQRSDSAYAEGEVDLNTLLLTQRQRIQVARTLVVMEFATMEAMCRLREAVGGSFDLDENRVRTFEIEPQPREEETSS